MPSRWTKYISKSGNIRVVAVEGREVIEETIRRHDLSDPMKKGIGEAVLAGLLLAACHKPGERINLSIQSSGPWRQAVVDSYPEGFVRAFIAAGTLGDWKNSSRGPWGNGLLTVLHTKNAEGQKPYSGTVSLETGFLDRDLNFYWQQSEQLASNAVFSKSARQAILVQAIAGATPEEVKVIHECTEELRKLAEQEVLKIVEPLNRIFSESNFSVIEDNLVQFRCNCSQERVEQALLLTSVEDLRYLLGEHTSIDTKCDFCSTHYIVSRARAEELIKTLENRKTRN